MNVLPMHPTRIGLALCVSMLAVGCNPTAPPQTTTEPVNEPAKAQLTVTTAKPERATFRYKIEGPGEIQADEQTPMFAKISGYVQKINKDIGGSVKEGAVVAELSVPEFDAELLQKEALVLQAKAELERAQKLYGAAAADVRYAEAKIKEAAAGRPRAAAELGRAQSTYERLKKTSAVLAEEVVAETRLGFESAQAAVAEVEAKVKAAEAFQAANAAKRDTAQTDISVAAARVRVAEAAARIMTELLKYAKLTAPYAGVIIKRNVDLGHFVQSSAAGGKGEPLFVMARKDPVRVFVDVPENDAVLIADGTKASVRVQALKGEEFTGTVQRSAWALDPKGRILRTEIDLPNPHGKLRPGMYAFATITVVHEKVWAIPTTALTNQDDQTFCFFAVDGQARRTAVLVGFRAGPLVEISKKRGPGADGGWQDMSGTEIVITGSPAPLVDGQLVHIANNP